MFEDGQYRQAGRNRYVPIDIVIPLQAEVVREERKYTEKHVETGAWVQAWVWVPDIKAAKE
jgi:hypothetical protein